MAVSMQLKLRDYTNALMRMSFEVRPVVRPCTQKGRAAVDMGMQVNSRHSCVTAFKAIKCHFSPASHKTFPHI